MERTDHVLGDYIKTQTCSGEMDLSRRLLAVAIGLGCYSECLCVCVAACPARRGIHTTRTVQAAEVCVGAIRIPPGIVLACSAWNLVLFQATQVLSLTLTWQDVGSK